MIKPPPGKTSEDLLKEGPPNGMPKEVFDLVIKRLQEEEAEKNK